ncbi:MAG TPA: hypothetical protein VGI74_27055 [Streptosporangiaceae bacterium]|jgi:hypothetical protein
MPATPGKPVSPALQRRLDKTQTRRLVAAMLDGSELAIAERKTGLVITNPNNRRQGRIHIEYGTGFVTHDYTVSAPWGLLHGYEDQNGNDTPSISADRIINTLTPKSAR